MIRHNILDVRFSLGKFRLVVSLLHLLELSRHGGSCFKIFPTKTHLMNNWPTINWNGPVNEQPLQGEKFATCTCIWRPTFPASSVVRAWHTPKRGAENILCCSIEILFSAVIPHKCMDPKKFVSQQGYCETVTKILQRITDLKKNCLVTTTFRLTPNSPCQQSKIAQHQTKKFRVQNQQKKLLKNQHTLERKKSFFF